MFRSHKLRRCLAFRFLPMCLRLGQAFYLTNLLLPLQSPYSSLPTPHTLFPISIPSIALFLGSPSRGSFCCCPCNFHVLTLPTLFIFHFSIHFPHFLSLTLFVPLCPLFLSAYLLAASCFLLPTGCRLQLGSCLDFCPLPFCVGVAVGGD